MVNGEMHNGRVRPNGALRFPKGGDVGTLACLGTIASTGCWRWLC